MVDVIDFIVIKESTKISAVHIYDKNYEVMFFMYFLHKMKTSDAIFRHFFEH